MKWYVLIMTLLCSLGGHLAQAEEWEMSPSDQAATAVESGSPTALPEPEEVAATAENESSDDWEAPPVTAEAFLKFDLTPVVESDRGVHLVSLEWRFQGIPPDTMSSFYVYAVPSPAAIPGSGGVPITTEDDIVGFWHLSPRAYARNGGGVVLFDLTDIVQEWVSGVRANHGVVIKTTAVERSDLESHLGAARLVVR